MVLLLALATDLCFARRATTEQMDGETLTLAEFLQDVRASYSRIEALLFRRGRSSVTEAAVRIQEKLEASKEPLDQALCLYLMGRLYHWDALNRAKSQRDPGVLVEASNRVAENHLQAFERLQQAVSAGGVPEGIEHDLIHETVRLFAARSWATGLSREMKTAAVERFLCVLEKAPKAETFLPEDSRTRRLYENLGVPERLRPLLPTELPTAFSDLAALLERCADDVPAVDLLPLANRLTEQHADALKGETDTTARLARVYCRTGDLRRTFDFCAGGAGTDPRSFLLLYILAFEPVLAIPETDRQSYLESYLANGKPADAPSGKTYKYERHDAYQQAVHALFQAGHYAECAKLVERCAEDTTSHYPVDMSLNMLRCRGQCLVAIGDREGAAAAFREYLDMTERSPKYARVRRLVGKELNELSVE